MKTVRLFDGDAYVKDFTANVLSSREDGNRYLTVLDRTAFFPEGGGQSSDTGAIGGVRVSHVFEKDGVIYHVTDSPVSCGAAECSLDFAERYRKMQNHTGEHVLCGVAHNLWGAENVGFHLSDEYVRVDLDVYLDGEKVKRLERLANDVVTENHAVSSGYPAPEELPSLDFRSKDGIEGDVRLVRIEGVDLCACCAPHVRSTAEVGLIKVVDSIKYKGGTRLSIVCGSDAVRLFIAEHEELSSLAESYSVKRSDLASAVGRQREELSAVSYKLKRAERALMESELEKIAPTGGDLCFFYDGADPENVRGFLNGAAAKCNIAAGFIGNDKEGYSYIIRSDMADLKALANEINGAIGGRGGGSPAMIRGTCSATRKTIEEYFGK